MLCHKPGVRKLVYNFYLITHYLFCELERCLLFSNCLGIIQFADSFRHGFKIDLRDNFRILIEISSCPRALTSRDFGAFKISDSFMLTELDSDVVIEALFNANWPLLFIIANITGILYTLKRILRAIIENLRTEISFAVHSVYFSLLTNPAG